MENKQRNILIIVLIIFGVGYYYFKQNQDYISKFFSLDNLDNFSAVTQDLANTVKEALKDTPANSDTAIIDQKLNAYVELINNVNENVQSSFDRYSSWSDLETGPTGKERNIYGLYQLNDYSTAFAEADRVVALQPAIPLDAIYLEYAQKYNTLKPLVEDAYTYYDQKNYKDDDMAAGRAQHEALVAAFKDFLAVADQLNSDYEKIDLVKRQEELQTLLDDGRQVAYDATDVLVSGQDVFYFIRNQLAENGDELAKISAEDFKKTVDQFEKALTRLTQLVKDNPDDVSSEYGMAGDTLMPIYISSSADYLKSMKALYRSLRDKQFQARDVFAKHTSGTPENLIYTYNTMVDKFNLMGKF